MNTYIVVDGSSHRTIVGLWCYTCMRPSVVQIPMLAIDPNGVTECGMYEGCVDCEQEEDEDGGFVDCG